MSEIFANFEKTIWINVTYPHIDSDSYLRD